MIVSYEVNDKIPKGYFCCSQKFINDNKAMKIFNLTRGITFTFGINSKHKNLIYRGPMKGESDVIFSIKDKDTVSLVRLKRPNDKTAKYTLMFNKW